jgi:ketosteroid isomerase-like protein
MYDWDADPADIATIKAWFDTWSPLVEAVDFVPARPLFEERIVSFGTKMDVVEGLGNLETNQWRGVWPTIRDFRFATETLRVGTSPDRLFAIGICTWTSTGVHEDGSTFDRPGRATVAFARASTDAEWKGVHTHISLAPGTPQKSHGSRSAKS